MKFTTPVSMPVTEAQYNELKPLLEAMGYEVRDYCNGFGCIATNYSRHNNLAMPVNHYRASIRKRLHIPTYHRELFLALAAMTDEPNGIAGEWWKCLYKAAAFTEGKIYKSFRPLQRQEDFVYDDDDQQSGIFTNDKNFTKATVAEIFAHFGVSYGKEQAEPIQPEIPQPIPLIPQGCTFKEWQRTLLLASIAQGCLSNDAPFDPEHWVNMTNELITELDKTK